ncbi:DUF4846 domain-containing protein [uncultured Treponema sp.]|uniref:DUF4846 domain-containing protein n=1 Tax=uncultured Treponema sp. TaxID=162155 RepID=UPI0025F59C37|nr:DUF4846 domain-containing protein [uncultured Treponema sp.]
MKKIFLAASLILFPIFAHADSFYPLTATTNEGMTLEERIAVPVDFVRVKAEKGSFAEYIRKYPLKEAESPVLLYDGRKKLNQEAHVAVFSLPLHNNEFQTASGSIIRLYAEYMRKAGLDKKIAFHLANGTVSRWTDWLERFSTRRNFRTKLAGNLKKWTEYENRPNEDEIFENYLKSILSNTNVLSVQIYESEPISFKKLKIGDVLWDLGNPEHLCLVVDLCVNPETGEKAVLLAQGGSPAQDFLVLKNLKRINNPWYHENDFILPLRTPEHTFPNESWRHLKYLD